VNALELARGIVPDFPTSAGRPFREPDESLLARRRDIARAARALPAEEATELAARTWRLWMAARDVGGGREFLCDVLDREERAASRWRVLALYGDGLLAYWAGDPEAARARNEEALALAQQLEDTEALLFAQLGRSRVAFEDGDAARAAELAGAAYTLAPDEATRQATVHMRAQSARLAGDFDTAAALFEESLALNQRIGDASMLPVEHHNLALVEIRRGNADAAERHLAELPPQEDEYVQALLCVAQAGVAFRKGDTHRARDLLDGVNGDDFATDDRAELEWLKEQLACAET
jgi:ATP/maltotriose-dependent transcriptional regulator MalT